MGRTVITQQPQPHSQNSVSTPQRIETHITAAMLTGAAAPGLITNAACFPIIGTVVFATSLSCCEPCKKDGINNICELSWFLSSVIGAIVAIPTAIVGTVAGVATLPCVSLCSDDTCINTEERFSDDNVKLTHNNLYHMLTCMTGHGEKKGGLSNEERVLSDEETPLLRNLIQ